MGSAQTDPFYQIIEKRPHGRLDRQARGLRGVNRDGPCTYLSGLCVIYGIVDGTIRVHIGANNWFILTV